MKYNPGSISISFLDLLSGALAGVIILFIIVPKGNTFTQGDMQEQKVSLDSLFIVIDSLYLGQDTLTTIDVSLLRENMLHLRTKIDSITSTGAQLRKALVQRKAKQVQLEDSLRTMRQQLRTAQQKKTNVRPAAPKPIVTKPPPKLERDKKAVIQPIAKANTPNTVTPQKSSSRLTKPRDPMPEMLDPFMVDVRWKSTSDVDLLLLNNAGIVICNDSRCSKKFAALERSGKRDTLQYERMRVISREPTTYDLRIAIHSGFGRKKGEGPVTVTGDYYIKQSPNAVATKRSFTQEVLPRQRGDNGAPGISIGSLTINTDGAVVFNPSKS